MIKSIIVGFILSFILLLGCTIANVNSETVFFAVFILLVGLAIIISGVAVSGDRMRANLATESKTDKKWRITNSINLMLAAAPVLGVFLFIHYFV
ncbi:DUF5316 family protein [Priestia megaterium]|uniref:DUF5316 family protein n=1 Tax=Priestia megaterium TaxID=1404 RepID=UPI000349A176|nr:DUF5316 family protein [Priestia megaterium]AYE51726.1 hypothetical protein OEA_18805 [Priestia megaterium NCT-2]MCR8925349.1 DUF5316 domain-containing protein [Priestia megaterium]UMZ34905.1 DUF5316 domain-containing protein [Priestia megaterium]